TMGGGARDDEVAGRLGGAGDLGPDAGIAGLQRAVLEVRPVAADGGVEPVAAPRVDGVVDALDPFDVGAEPALAREVEGEVDAEPRLLRHRVDEVMEGRTSREGEIDASAEIVARDRLRRDAGDAARERRRVEPRAVDEKPRLEGHGLGAADLEREAA